MGNCGEGDKFVHGLRLSLDATPAGLYRLGVILLSSPSWLSRSGIPNQYATAPHHEFLCTKNQTPCRRRSPPPSPLPTVASAPGVVLALKTSLLLLHAAWLAGSGVLAAALDDGLGTTPRAGALGRRKQHESTDECYDTTHTDLEAFDQADLARFISELFATPEDTIFVKAGSQRSKDGDKCRICINNYSSKDTSVRLWEMAWAAGYAVNKINGNGCCPDTDSLCRGGLLTGHGTNNAEVRIGVQSAGSKCVPMATMEAHL